MAGRGGYQKPSSPAPVSGPGSMSRRTDGGPAQKLRDLPDAQYGEAATYRDLQQGAPLAQSPAPSTAPATGGGGGGALSSVPFGAPTGRPNEPVTNGAPYGPGAGPEALASNYLQQQDVEGLRQVLPVLEQMAALPTASPVTRNLVRRIRAGMPL